MIKYRALFFMLLLAQQTLLTVGEELEESSEEMDEFEVDDDGRIYKNPRNSPSALCPRDEEQANLMGQKCLRKCSTDEDCKSKKKKCLCDGACGMSCIKPERECEELRHPSRGQVTMTGRLFGDKASYSCTQSARVVGPVERTCQADGSWSGNNPVCKENIYCTTPPLIDHSRHSAQPDQMTFDLNAALTYSCYPGYVTKGFPTAKCLEIEGTASWFGPDISCEPRSCGTPADTAHGWHAGECYTFGCRVAYHCADGYQLVGRVERYCQADGTWSPKELPTCVLVTAVQCPPPENPAHGSAIFTSSSYNSVVSYECKYGYTLSGDATRKCGADKKWSGVIPQCKEINCGHPGPLYNGWLENIEAGTGLGTSIIYRCHDGMKMEGNTSSVCQIDGRWRYPLPRCLAPCVVPGVQQGRVTLAPGTTALTGKNETVLNVTTVVQHGELLSVECNLNYEFLPSNNQPVACNNGTWTHIPRCDPARCKKMPKSPRNGMVIAPKTDHGMKARYKCKDGYTLKGTDTTECLYGNWTGVPPYCQEVYCPFPGTIDNGKVMLVGNMGLYDYRPYVRKVTNNKQIMYDCDRGYVLADGPPGATCIGGRWSPKQLPRCVPGLHPRLRWSRSVRSSEVKQALLDNYYKHLFKKMESGIVSGGANELPVMENETVKKFLDRMPRRKRHILRKSYHQVESEVVVPGRPMMVKRDKVTETDISMEQGSSENGIFKTENTPLALPVYGGIKHMIDEFGKIKQRESTEHHAGHTGQSSLKDQTIARMKRAFFMDDFFEESSNQDSRGSSYQDSSNQEYEDFKIAQMDQFLAEREERENAKKQQQAALKLKEAPQESVQLRMKRALMGNDYYEQDDKMPGSVEVTNTVPEHQLIRNELADMRAKRQLIGENYQDFSNMITDTVSGMDDSLSDNELMDIRKKRDVLGKDYQQLSDRISRTERGLELLMDHGVTTDEVAEMRRKRALGMTGHHQQQRTQLEKKKEAGRRKNKSKGGRKNKGKGGPKGKAGPCEILSNEPFVNIEVVKKGRNPNQTNSIGTVVQVVCGKGYGLNIGFNTTAKCMRGMWKPDKPECTILPCFIPPTPHGLFRLAGAPVLLNLSAEITNGEVVQFSCRHGYNVKGPGNLRCWHGEWAITSYPECTPSPCQLPQITNGQYLGGYRAGLTIANASTVNFQCDTDYAKSTLKPVECVLGELRPRTPACRLQHRNPPYRNGTVRMPEVDAHFTGGSDITKGGDVGEVDYSMGYRRTCGPPARVQGSLVYRDGEPLEDLEKSSFTDGTEVTFHCIASIMGEKTTWRIVCEDGSWVGRSLSCESEDLLDSAHGPFRNSSCMFRNAEPNLVSFYNDQLITEEFVEFPAASVVTSRCMDIGKFSMTGSNHRKCVGGEWAGAKPVCFGLNQENDYALEKPPTILFRHQLGPISQSNDGKLVVYPGTIVHMECLWVRRFGTPKWNVSHNYRKYPEGWTDDPGRDPQLEYRLSIFHASKDDSGTFTCITPTRHTHSVDIIVQAVHCPVIPPRRGLTLNTVSTKMNTRVLFSCANGNSLIGAPELVCHPSGNWSAPIPVCESIECADLANMTDPFLRVSIVSREVGGRAVFSCGAGFGLRGPVESVCQASGDWSTPLPTCQEVQCAPPPTPENGYIQGSGPYKAGDVIQFNCNPEFMMEGQPIIACQENTRWSGPIPKCVQACSYPGTTISGRMSAVKFFYHIGESITFTCDPGFELKGTPMLRCLRNGKWSNAIPTCVSTLGTHTTR